MLANVARHAERIITVKAISLTIYSMHDSNRMSPKNIRKKGLGKEVRSLLHCILIANGHPISEREINSQCLAPPFVGREWIGNLTPLEI